MYLRGGIAGVRGSPRPLHPRAEARGARGRLRVAFMLFLVELQGIPPPNASDMRSGYGLPDWPP